MPYPAVPSTVAVARGAVAALAEAHGASPERVDSVRLAVSEAVTNAVLHGYPEGGGEVRVTAMTVREQLLVVVEDDGRGIDEHAQSPGLGLGLPLIAAHTDHWTLATPPHGGVQVEMRFDLQSTRPSPRHLGAAVVASGDDVHVVIREHDMGKGLSSGPADT
jgi:anti-sigma regulatory factor (Ser/Thr protein kinase)